MKHKAIPKKIREQVYQKYNGHCAYCGCSLEYKDMQVDHIESLYSKSGYFGTIDDPNITQDDNISNLMPSCRQCNYYKSANDIEGLRRMLKTLMERVKKPFIYRLAEKYGMVQEIEWDGKFYFERQWQD